MKFGVDYAHNTGNQHYRRRKWNSGVKSFVEEEMPCKNEVVSRQSNGNGFFWDFIGVLLVDFLHTCRIVNAAYYCNLLEQVRKACQTKRRGFPIQDVLLLHNNARPHSTALTQEKLAQMYWTAQEHPLYSPDLSPCDYHMFGPLKEALGWAAFRQWWAGREFCAQVATDASCFILRCRNKKTPNPLAKMHRESWKLCRKVRIFIFCKIMFQ